jgi:ribosome-associated heat shock protein Hsp15
MDQERHRIDMWLKLVCLFKQRGDAAEACRGGHVKINGQRAKPAAVVREGDVIEFYHGDRFRKVVVTAIPERPVRKEEARTMYDDQSPQPQRLEVLMGGSRDRGAGRPTKRERREMEKVRR